MFRYLISLIFILIVLVGSAAIFFPEYWVHRYDDLISRQARVYRIDEKLVWSVIYEETYFRAWKVGAAEEVGLHMSMQHGNTMHMASVQSLPVPGEDSVLFAPLGAHVMLTRMTRAYAAGDTIALTLTFASGQSLEVRAGVRQP